MLVIDDEHAIRSVLSSVLTRAGYDVLEAGHVAEAWKQLLTHDVDVMICDVRLPDGSGVDLVRATCAQLPDVAVVMLTGVDDPLVAAEVFQLGAAAYLVKPFGSNEILINVANALRLRDLERARRAHEYEMERKLLSRNQALTAVLRRVEAAGVRTALDDREAADRLAAALSLRHEETGRHIERVGIYAGLLAAAGGWTDWTRVVRQAADGRAGTPQRRHAAGPRRAAARRPPAHRHPDQPQRSRSSVTSPVASGIDAVADQLGISSSAVQVHVDSSGDKLGGHTRLDVVVAAVRQGLVRPG